VGLSIDEPVWDHSTFTINRDRLHDPRLKAKADLKAQIDALLKRAARSDEVEANEPQLDIPAEIERREARLEAIGAARERL
jgi:hypothetical protein